MIEHHFYTPIAPTWEAAIDHALERRARRAAKRIGMLARKSRWRANSIDNHGGFMLLDPNRKWVVAGSRYELSAQDVLTWCEEAPGSR
jgi:hypothetical protein